MSANAVRPPCVPSRFSSVCKTIKHKLLYGLPWMIFPCLMGSILVRHRWLVAENPRAGAVPHGDFQWSRGLVAARRLAPGARAIQISTIQSGLKSGLSACGA